MLKQAVVIILFAYTFHSLIALMDWIGLFQRVFNHAPGKCHHLQLIDEGSEDIQSLPNGLAFISSGLWLANTEEYTRRRGRVYLFDFNRPNHPPQELSIESDDGNFRLYSPHGLNVWIDPESGTSYLYLISHHPAEIVDKFRFDEKTPSLVHLRRISGDQNFHSLNDLVVVAEDKFYFTNYIYSGYNLELVAMLRWGSLCFFNGTHSTVLESGLWQPNGVMTSRDKGLLYMSHLGDQELRTYKRLDNDGVRLIHTLKVHTALDNLHIDDKTGHIWSGAHLALYQSILHFADQARFKTPSQVIKILVNSDGLPNGNVVELYSNNGDELSGSSVAVHHGNGLLIGTVAGRALYCQLGSSDSTDQQTNVSASS